VFAIGMFMEQDLTIFDQKYAKQSQFSKHQK
jgi:hypothetical protein